MFLLTGVMILHPTQCGGAVSITITMSEENEANQRTEYLGQPKHM